jgi:hypothetical protein
MNKATMTPTEIKQHEENEAERQAIKAEQAPPETAPEPEPVQDNKPYVMTEKEYRAAAGLNYSSMASFSISPDHALMEFKPQSYFEEGKQFELMVQDACQNTRLFFDKYFICECSGAMPNNLIWLIENNKDLEKEYIYNADGITLSGKHKTKHAYLDECIANKGMLPVGNKKYAELKKLVDNMLKMVVMNTTVKDILANAQFQVPIFWEYNGILKKALLDCVTFYNGNTYCFDIKTSANDFEFKKNANSKYWIQKNHYTEGANIVYGNVRCFTFLVAYKEKPFLCQPVNIAGDQTAEYNDVCYRYTQWIKAGKPAVGYLPERNLYLYKK